MQTLEAIWRRITTTPTARALEEGILPHIRALEAEGTRQRAEIARLRDENRALLNSILGIAGVPPVVVGEVPPGLPSINASRAPEIVAVASAETSSGPHRAGHAVPLPNNSGVAAPLRRRSWQQVHRALEFAALQKKEPREDPLT